MADCQEHGAVTKRLASLSMVTNVRLSFIDWNEFTASSGGLFVTVAKVQSVFSFLNLKSRSFLFSH